MSADWMPPLPRAAIDEHNLQGGRVLDTAAQMRRAQADAARAALEAAATKCESIYRKWNAGSENADRYRVQDETVDACAHFIRALAKEVT